MAVYVYVCLYVSDGSVRVPLRIRWQCTCAFTYLMAVYVCLYVCDVSVRVPLHILWQCVRVPFRIR